MSDHFNCLIMGAAGRDFHNFLTFFRDRPNYCVRAFTAAQIPYIESRRFPRSLAGPHYSDDIPIVAEGRLGELIREMQIDLVFFAYSDVSHLEVMHKASSVQSCGASFVLLGPDQTQLVGRKPAIAVTAVRTGAGKSPVSRWLAKCLSDRGRRVAVLRHPMPYGNLERQAVERFATFADLEKYECSIEEREEYEPYLERGLTVFAGVNYRRILDEAEREADAVLWDGGNNDFPFIRPTYLITLVDARRPGQLTTHYPGETNLLAAHVVVINKISRASTQEIEQMRRDVRTSNPTAQIIESDLELVVVGGEQIRNRRVLVVEDGPTLTHGGMADGAGTLAAQQFAAGEIIDPRPFAVGTMADAFRQFPHLGRVLPALGYSPDQCRELRETIENSGADLVVDGSPCRIDRLLDLSIPTVRIGYEFHQRSGPDLLRLVEHHLDATNATTV